MTNFKRMSWWSTVVAALAVVGLAGVARASSHREAPAISNDPAADNTDLWAWVDSSQTNLNVVASYIPMEEPSGGPNFHKFSDDVLYEIHITDPGSLTGGDDGGASYDLKDQLTYQIRFTTATEQYVTDAAGDAVGGGVEFFSQLTSYINQSYTVNVVDGSGNVTQVGSGNVAPPNIGPRTNADVYSAAGFTTDYETFAETFITSLSGGGSAFAGPRDDGFYTDLGAIFDLANLRAGPFTDGGTNAAPSVDGVAGYNVHTIALSIPISGIHGGGLHAGTSGDDSMVGVWASASRKKVSILRNDGTTTWTGPWTQVSRLGLPLINEAVIGIQDKDKYNRTTPASDVANFAAYFTVPTIVRDAELVGDISAGQSAAITGPRYDILNIINLSFPGLGAVGNHHVPIAPGATGDVLRVDLSVASGFPNGRKVGGGAKANQEQNNVTDILLSVLLTGGTSGVSTNVAGNDADYLTHFPYLAAPWEGFSQGHGKVPPAN